MAQEKGGLGMTRRIETERLVLRPYTAADGDAVVTGLNDFEVSKWLGRVPHPFTHADLRITDENGESEWPRYVAIEMDGRVVGGTGIGDHLGYWIARDHWGKGIATEAARAMTRFHFETSAAGTLQSGYFEGNRGSARVLEKCGFRENRRGPNHSVSNGRDLPHVWMELTRSDWEARA